MATGVNTRVAPDKVDAHVALPAEQRRIVKLKRILYAALVASAIAMAGTMYLLVSGLVTELDKVHGTFRDNITNSAAQADYELLTLIDRLERFGDAADTITHQQLVDRFDVFWSRIDTNSSGANGEYYLGFEGAPEAIADLRQTMAEIEPQIMALQPGDAAAAKKLAATMRGFVARLHGITLIASYTNAKFVGELWDTLSKTVFWVVILLPGMLLAGFSIAGLLWYERRRLNFLNNTLEHRVEERTSDIQYANQQLQQEITERTQTEKALKRSRDQLRLVTDNLPAWIAFTDADRRFQFINKTCSRWLSMPVEEILGKPVQEIFKNTAVYETIRPYVDRALAGEQVNYVEEMTFHDGVTRSVQVTYVPHFGDAGDVEGYYTLIDDVSDLRRTEEALQQAQKMEAVGQLTGGVAHDFNNLLAVILGNTELLENDIGENSLLTSIDRAACRGAELTQRLLAFSRQQKLAPQSVGLADLVSGLDDLLLRTLGEPVKVLTNVPEEVWPVFADPGQLENALLNLAINARDAMPNGGILSISCSNVELEENDTRVNGEVAAGDYVQIAVRDTGTGMDEDTIEHAFEPFFTTKDVGDGSGLGLSMIYGFAQQSGGDAVIESEPGEGTEVRIFLRRSNEAAASNDPLQNRSLDRGKGEVILVLEDDPDVQNFTVTILERLGYRVRAASEANAAMHILEEEADNLDLLLSDLVLPGGVSGAQFAVMAKDLCPRLKIVFMTGYAQDLADSEKIADISEAFLNKPFKRGHLTRVIQNTLAA